MANTDTDPSDLDSLQASKKEVAVDETDMQKVTSELKGFSGSYDAVKKI